MDNNNLNSNQENDLGLKDNFKSFVSSLWILLRTTLSFADEVDKVATIKGIKSEIEFKGFNIWILIFSIIIASIGLNTNSTAVIIGAMLISPLMGPIMGVGLSLGTNDWPTLMRSFKSLVITVGVSLVTSTLYFLITPFGEAGDELLGRTHPELRDVFIAIFGGLAGIMANTRNKVTNVIPGVAIATALMPPLCTAGYGIATLNWKFFSGAFYLFLINSVYIALTSFLVIRYLKFPLVHLLDELKERKFKKYILFFSVILIVPSIYTLINSYNKNSFERKARAYVSSYFTPDEIRHSTIDYNDGEPKLEIFLFGKKKLSDSEYELALSRFDIEPSEAKLRISEDTQYDDMMKMIESSKNEQLKFSENNYVAQVNMNRELQQRNDSLKNAIRDIYSDSIPFLQLSQELKIIYNDIAQFEYGVYKVTNYETVHEVPTFHIRWKRNLKSNKQKEATLKKWLEQRLKLESVRVVSF